MDLLRKLDCFHFAFSRYILGLIKCFLILSYHDLKDYNFVLMTYIFTEGRMKEYDVRTTLTPQNQRPWKSFGL